MEACSWGVALLMSAAETPGSTCVAGVAGADKMGSVLWDSGEMLNMPSTSCVWSAATLRLTTS